MAIKLHDFDCPTHGSFEHLFFHIEPTQTQSCPTCQALSPRRCSAGGVQTIVMGNSDFNDRQKNRLEKRSNDHWKRKGRNEAGERARETMKNYHST